MWFCSSWSLQTNTITIGESPLHVTILYSVFYFLLSHLLLHLSAIYSIRCQSYTIFFQLEQRAQHPEVFWAPAIEHNDFSQTDSARSVFRCMCQIPSMSQELLSRRRLQRKNTSKPALPCPHSTLPWVSPHHSLKHHVSPLYYSCISDNRRAVEGLHHLCL